MLFPALLLGTLMLGGDKVVINEFSYDDSGVDDFEFVELYNPTTKNIDISGWVLNSTDPFGPNKKFTVPASTTLNAGAWYVFGSAKVPNVNQVVGTTNIWENSNESLILLDKDGNVVDSLIYEANKGRWAASTEEGEGVWGNFANIAGHETSWSRVMDGYDINNNRNFRLQPWTPGKSNNLPQKIYLDNFDARTVGTALPDFGGSFATAQVIDPTMLSADNPNVIPASPQGKNAAIFWDKSGGGNHNMLLRKASCNTTIEAYVYFDAKFEQTGEREHWSLGVGTTGTFYNSPDPSGKLGFSANGNTGVSWTFEVTDKNATLYLIDHNDGGAGTRAKTPFKVLGKIDVKVGTNDGWQRLRLEVKGNQVTGFFGGTFGGTNGAKLTGTLAAPAMGGVYIGYREFVLANATTRPFTCDRMLITSSSTMASVSANIGAATKTTKGTPRLGGNGCPLVGNTSFALTGVDLVPTNPSLWLLGVRTTPINLGAVGGQTGSFLYVTPVVVLAATSDANGDATIPLPIANSAGLKGVVLDGQILDFDAALSVALKFGNSRMTSIRID